MIRPLVVLLVALAGCGPAAAGEQPPRAEGTARVKSKQYTRFDRIRLALAHAQSSEWISLEMGRDTFAVESSNAPSIDTLRSLVIVNVFIDFTRVGGTSFAEPGDAAAHVTKLAQLARPVFLVRVEDDVPAERVVATLSALKRGGAEHVVVGFTPPSWIVEKWDDCPFPAEADRARVDKALVLVQVDLDGESRAGVVHVLDEADHGFGGAAALCLATRRFDARTNGKPFRIRFER